MRAYTIASSILEDVFTRRSFTNNVTIQVKPLGD